MDRGLPHGRARWKEPETPLIEIKAAQARHLILHLQGLTRPYQKAFANGELENLIDQMGFVQLDSIRWVERAHHMTLAARSQAYKPIELERLHEGGVLFENWTHDASLIPTRFWKYWKHKFARDEVRLGDKFTRWQGDAFKTRVDELAERITKQGVLRSRDLEKPKGQKLEMWQWHDGKAALEFMWRTGKLAVPRREGFQKVYDLSQRVIPDEHFISAVSRDEFIDWTCRSALDRLGFGSAKNIAGYWDLLKLDEVKAWLEERGAQETKTIVIKDSADKKPREFHARLDIENLVQNLPKIPERIRMLSPFDPVIRDRKRLSWLFNFDYTIEIYVPPEKRVYGYYVFPLLERDRLIGRIDCQAKRSEDCLYITKVWLEPKARWSASRQKKLEGELLRQAKLCCVSRLEFGDDWLSSKG